MKKYRVWLVDSVEEEGGSWWYCYLTNEGTLQDYTYPDEHADTVHWYITNGYKVEEL